MSPLLLLATLLCPAQATTPSMFLPNGQPPVQGAGRVDLPMVVGNRVEVGVVDGLALGLTTSLPFLAATGGRAGFALPSLRGGLAVGDSAAVGIDALGGVGYLGGEAWGTGGGAAAFTFADDIEDVEAGSVTAGVVVLRFPERWRVQAAVGGGLGGMWQGRKDRTRVWELWYANLDGYSHAWGGLVGPRWTWDTARGSWALDTALAVFGSDELAPIIPLPWLSASYRWHGH